jgi:hypothetical protein
MPSRLILIQCRRSGNHPTGQPNNAAKGLAELLLCSIRILCRSTCAFGAFLRLMMEAPDPVLRIEVVLCHYPRLGSWIVASVRFFFGSSQVSAR